MSNPRTLLAIVGMAGSGKSIASDFFRSKNIPVLRFGDQTDLGLKEAGLQLSEANERSYREQIRKELGMAAMAIKIEPRIEEAYKTHAKVVLDGLYSWEEYVYLKTKYPYIKLLCIFTPADKRYERLATREIRPLTQEEAEARDVAEIENLHKGGPIAMADYILINDSDTKSLLSGLEAFI
jgi:dephospho-CoA kinase